VAPDLAPGGRGDRGPGQAALAPRGAPDQLGGTVEERGGGARGVGGVRSHLPAQVYGSTYIELAWTILPLLIVVVLFRVTARYIWGLERRAQPPDALPDGIGRWGSPEGSRGALGGVKVSYAPTSSSPALKRDHMRGMASLQRAAAGISTNC
jgi:hypothetical protein